MDMNATQCRMARAALGWSIADLAKASGVRDMTVSSFERGRDAYASTITKLRLALEDAGVAFLAEGEASLSGGAGVRLKG